MFLHSEVNLLIQHIIVQDQDEQNNMENLINNEKTVFPEGFLFKVNIYFNIN